MQKGAKRILGALIVLIMVLSILPASVFATEDAEGVLKGWSITLSDEIGVKFHLNSADYDVTATVNGKEVTPTISDEGVVTVNVAAAQMTVPVVLTVKDGADTVYTGEYSVREYAETILNDTTGEYAGYVKDMVKQMLNYGAAAQEYFGYNTENLANAGYELESNAQVPTGVPEIVETGSLNGIELYGMSLVLESKTAVRFYFTGNVSGHEFKVGDTKYTPVAKSGMHFVEIDGINPQDLANAIKLNVDDTWSITYSPMNYIVRMSNKEGSSDSMKSLVQSLYSYHQEAKYYDSVVPVGALQSSRYVWSTSGIYATMPENDAYFVQDNWSVEYTPVSADVIKLVRDGVTTSVGMPGQGTLIKFTTTDYYLKTEPWTIGGEVLPLQDQDYLIIDGRFQHPATGSVMYISKTYIYNNNGTLEFSTTEPVLPVTYDIGVLQASVHGAGDGGIYFQTAEVNDAPWDNWNTYYDSQSVDNIKLIRGGETISVGLTDRNTICKFGINDYYLKLEGYTIGDYAPFTKDDMFIVEGAFTHKNSKTTLNVETTYIYHDGVNWVFSATKPGTTPGTETVINGGNLDEHADGWDAAGEIFVSMTENDLPVDENAEVEYTAQSGVIKLVRGGNTSELTGTIIKYGAADYLMILDGDTLPLQANDYLIVAGDFVNADNGNTLNVAQTYILVDGKNLVYSTTEPEVKLTYEVGVLNSHGAGVATGDNGIKGIYATSIATDATSGSWSYEYTPVASENYKLIRDGVTYNVGRPGEGTLVMFGQTEYYLKQETNTFDSSLLPLQKGDILVLEGNWSCNQDAASVITIDTTYILIVGESAVKFSAEMPNVVKINVLKESQNGRAGSGFYATADANSAPLNTDWSLRYKAQSADAVKYVSNGVTSNVADTEAEMLVKFSEYDYFFEGNTLGGTYANIAAGDMYIVNGLFYNAANNVYIHIDTTYIQFTANDELFSSTEPVPEVIHQIGVLAESNNGTRVDTAGTVTGVYAVADVNDAPYGDWNIEYTPASASGLKLVRDGVTYNVGVTGAGTIVKFTENDYFVKLEAHTIKFSDNSSVLPMQDGDMLIIEGNWVQASDATVKVNFANTYILLDGTKAIISDTEPAIIPVYEVGVLASHSAGVNVDATVGIKGIYATCTATDATYNTDWSVEYTPVSAENYKLIRGGVTYNVGVPGAGTLVLFSQTDIYLKQEGNTFTSSLLPLQAGDILVVEGKWSCNQDANSIINITKTYISIGSNSAVFSAEDPRIINVGTMYAHNAGYSTSGDGNISGIYFMNKTNAVPSDEGWNVRYAATDASNVKLIRNGVTTNIAVVGANTIVKMSDQAGWLCLENASIISTYPIVAGDVLVVEGAFRNASNGYTMVIDKTYIVVGSDGVTFTTHYEVTDFGTVILPTSTEDMTIGVWNGSHHVFADKQLQELQAAGITKIMGVNPLWIGADNVNAWLDRVYSYGISVIFDLREWDGTADYKWTYEGQETAFTLGDLVNHKAVLGFLMYDEPGADVFDDLKTLKAQFDEVMPADKLFYVNLFPECAADSSLGTESSWWDKITGNTKDYDTDYVTEFLKAVNIEVLSWDNYPLITNSAGKDGIRTDYFHNFEVMASKNLPLWYTMLSAGHTAGASDTYYDTPTAEELRWQMAVAMTYGVQNIDHYIYASHEDDYSCMVEYGTWNPTALYYDIKTVDNEYLAWDHIFMAYDWQGVGVYDTGSSNAMLTALENKLNLANYGLTVTSSNQNLLVGVFDHNGDKAYMVTNAGSAGSSKVGDGKNFVTADATVTLTLADGDYQCAAVIDNGEISYVAVNNNTVTLNVEAYEGVFVIPVLN